jgi:hypothetical protein
MLHAAPDVRLDASGRAADSAVADISSLQRKYRHDGAAQLHSIRADEFKSFLMTDFAGVKSALTAGRHWILRQDSQVPGQWFIVSERGVRNNFLEQHSLYSNRGVLPFAPRLNRDDVAAVLLRDAEHPPCRGRRSSQVGLRR